MTPRFKYTVYPVLWIISIIPFPVLYRFSDLLSFVLHYIVRYRIAVVKGNLKASFPDKSQKELARIERKYYVHLTDLILETIKGMSISKSTLLKRMKLMDKQYFDQQMKLNKSTIVVMSHCGNWEWVCLAAQISVEQHAQCVYKTLSNSDWDEWFFNTRSRFGTAPFTMEKTLRVMTANSHLCCATAFIGDQNPSTGKTAYWTRFLNQDTPFMQGSEKIARKLNQDVVYMKITKLKRGYYTCEVQPLASESAKTKDGEITDLIVKAIENDILSQPQNWLWSHKRWKHVK